MYAAMQLQSCCISGVAENVTNLARPNTYCLGNFQMASTFIVKYYIVKAFIKNIYTYMYISIYVSPSVSFARDGIFSENQKDLDA